MIDTLALMCDHPGCTRRNLAYGSPRSGRAKKVRRRALKEGWTRTDVGQDLCPGHSAGQATGPPERRGVPGHQGEPFSDVDAEIDPTFELGIETAGEARLQGLEQGLSDPVVVMARIDEDGREKIDVRIGERDGLAEWLAGSHPEAAACLKEGTTPELPMTIVVEHRGVIKIADLPHPWSPVEQG
jgi:hypothetical protein